MRLGHPAVVHFPIACWVLAALLDGAALAGLGGAVGAADPAAIAAFLVWTGLAFAVGAVVTGLVDYSRLPPAVRDSLTLTRHVGWMAAASTLFFVAALLRPPLGAAPAPLIVSLEVLGTVALVAGGHHAASVVFCLLPSVRASTDAPSDLVTTEESES